MAHLMLKQEYPHTPAPAQAAPSRDNQHNPPLDYSALDNVDAEAGSILIALANQSTPMPSAAQAHNESSPTRLRDASDDGNRPMEGVRGNASGNSRSMSISSLLGGSSGLTMDPMTSDAQDATDPIMILAAAAAAIDGRGQRADDDMDMPSGAWRSRTETTYMANHRQQQHTTYYSPTRRSEQDPEKKATQMDQVSHRNTRTSGSHHPLMSPASGTRGRWRPETSTSDDYATHRHSSGVHAKDIRAEEPHGLSYQYLSMKQNPRIKRNAMHAYITYMIYTDMSLQERSHPSKSKSTGEYDKDMSSSFRARHATHAQEARTSDRYIQRRDTYGSTASNAPTNRHVDAQGSRTRDRSPVNDVYPSSTSERHRPRQSGSVWFPASNAPTPSSSSTASYYRLPPSPTQITPDRATPVSSLPHPSSNSPNPIMMGRPLTAFLREGPGHSGNRPPFGSPSSPPGNGHHTTL